MIHTFYTFEEGKHFISEKGLTELPQVTWGYFQVLRKKNLQGRKKERRVAVCLILKTGRDGNDHFAILLKRPSACQRFASLKWVVHTRPVQTKTEPAGSTAESHID